MKGKGKGNGGGGKREKREKILFGSKKYKNQLEGIPLEKLVKSMANENFEFHISSSIPFPRSTLPTTIVSLYLSL